jgi:hypothetical protein
MEPSTAPFQSSVPGRAELDAATAATAAALADPSASAADIYRAAEAEEAAFSQVEPGPCDRLTEILRPQSQRLTGRRSLKLRPPGLRRPSDGRRGTAPGRA